MTGQDAFIPQEYRVDLHFCPLPGGLSNRFRPESDISGIEAEDTLGEESPKVGASVEAGTLFLLAAGSVPAATGWPENPILPSLMARFAAKYFSTSIFLIRAIAAPVVLFKSPTAFIGAAEDGGRFRWFVNQRPTRN